MKRLLLALAALLFWPSLAMANACASNLGGNTGNWTTVGTWTSCGAVAPTAADTCTITSGDTVLINSAAAVCGVTTINGTVLGQPVAVASAHILTITADGTAGTSDLLIGATGTLRLRKNNRIAFDTNNGAGADKGATITVTNGGVLDAQGEVFETTIAAITAIDGDAGCGTTGRKYTITPAAGIGNAQANGRIVFESGPGETRHLEITSVAATSFVVCTDYPDASSGTDTTGGQRLTPHAAFQGAHAFPAGRHSVPILGGVAGCSAASTPYRCCTGVDTGTCTGSDPVVGDKIAIVQDVWFYVSAATDSPPKGYYIAASNVSPLPIFRAVNFANAGATDVAGGAGVGLTALNNTQTSPDFMFNNYHDSTANGDQITFRGMHDFKIYWNAVHDGRVGSGESSAALGFGSDTTCGATCKANNVTVSGNALYRTYGGALHLNQPNLAGIRATGVKALKNLIFDNCITATGECLAIQTDLCDSCLIANNLIYDMTNGNNAGGQALYIGTGTGSAYVDNWIVNGGDRNHGTVEGGHGTTDWFAATHNYVSNVAAIAAFVSGPAYSNVAKNIGLANASLAANCFRNPMDLKGNYCIGQDTNDTSHYAAADCDLAGDQGCLGIAIFLNDNNANKNKVTITDNLIIGPFGAAGLRGIKGDAAEPMDFSADIDHNTIDARGSSIYGIDINTVPNPTPAITINMRDNVGFHFNNTGQMFVCSTQANITDVAGNSYISTGVTSAEKVVAGAYPTNGDCASFGTQTTVNSSSAFRDRAALALEFTPDFNWLFGNPGLTGGSNPASSPLGVRALRFNQDRITKPWSNQIAFDGSMPVTICNVASCTDTDGDGVIDLHDNCKFVWNPSQLDTDGNGVGDACQ